MDSFTGGLYSSDGEFIEDSLLYRGRQAQLQKSIEYLHGTYVYGGCLFYHLGHFIWESLSRLYTMADFYFSSSESKSNHRYIKIYTLIVSR